MPLFASYMRRTADALLIYAVDVRRLSKLADWCSDLQKVVKQKSRGVEADKMKVIIDQHNQCMDDTLSEDRRLGQYFSY